MQSTHPASQQLAAYKSGKLPDPDASTIEAHLSNCDTCCDVLAQLNVTNPLEKRLRGKRPSVPTVDQPVQDWIDDLRDRNPLAQTSREGTDDFLKRLAPAQSPGELGRLGRYRVLKQLGRGGMGAVYLAHDTKLNRQVALKIPRFSPDDEPRYLERFLREARAAASLDHPGICHINEADEIDGVHFISMAYIDGKPLSEFVGGKPVPPRQVAAVIRELALALEDAHTRGIIHRDLKPSNIMVNKRRKLVIMDFGLAGHFRLTDTGDKSEKSRLTSSGMIIGTPAYMSPEQATGDIAAMGPACDIYSLGVIMYELLTGELPFDGPPAAVLGQIMVAEPPRPSSLRPGLDPQLEAICLKAMAKKIGNRHASMTELARTLSDFLQTKSDQIKRAKPRTSRADANRPPSKVSVGGDDALGQFFAQLEAEKQTESGRGQLQPQAATRTTRKRNHPALCVAAAAAFLLLAIGGYTIWIKTGEGTIRIELADNSGEVSVHVDGNIITIEKLADPITLHAGKHELVVTRGGLVVKTTKFTVNRGSNPVLDVAFFPNDLAGTQSVKNEPGNAELDLLEKEIDGGLSIDQDDVRVVGIRSRLIEIHRERPGTKDALRAARLMTRLPWPLDLLNANAISVDQQPFVKIGEPPKFVEGIVAVLGDSRMKHWDRIGSLAFSPRDDLLAAASRDRTLKVWDAATGVLRADLGVMPAGEPNVAFSSDGRMLAAASSGTIKIWDVDGFRLRQTIEPNDTGNLSLAFSPQEKLLATGRTDHSIVLWDSDTGNVLDTLKGHTDGVWAVAFSPDGKTLASGSFDGTVRLWDMETRLVRKVIQTGFRISCLAFSPDNQTVAGGGDHWIAAPGTVKAWNATTGDDLFTLGGFRYGIFSLAFSKDGERLVTGAGRELKVWDVRTRTLLITFDHYWHGVQVAFNHDGGTLAAGDSAIDLYDASTWQLRSPQSRHSDLVTAVAVSPDGRALASASMDKTVKLWDLAAASFRQTQNEHTAAVRSVVYSPDGRWLASAGEDSTVIVRNAVTGDVRHKFERHSGVIHSLAFSPDSKSVASAGVDRVIRLWSVDNGQLRSLEGHDATITSVTFSPNGSTIASACEDKTVKIWDVSSGLVAQSLAGHTAVARCVAFSPDGQSLVSGDDSGTIRVWDLKTGWQRLAIQKHTQPVNSLAYSLDGTRLASAGSDGTVRIWNMPSGELQQTIQVAYEYGQVSQVVFAPSGRHLVTANFNGTAYVLRLENL